VFVADGITLRARPQGRGTAQPAMTSEQEGSEVTHILIFQEATSVLKNLSLPDPPKKENYRCFSRCIFSGRGKF